MSRQKSFAAVASGALVLVGAAQAVPAAPSVSVALVVQGSLQKEAGQFVTLVARAKLPAGDRIQITGTPNSGRTFVVAKCPSSPCSGSTFRASAGSVTFRALLATATTVVGRSKPVVVTWHSLPPPAPPPPPPPPPPAPFQPGHYKGTTSQNEDFEFDVSAVGQYTGGQFITGLHVNQINQSCQPSGFYLDQGGLNNYVVPIQADGSLSITSTAQIMFGSDPDNVTVTITGKLAGSTASGTLVRSDSITDGGTQYNCTSGNQTWSATLSG